jgi:hypothetical protein
MLMIRLEVSEIIGTLERKSVALLDGSLLQHEVEEIAESLDEEIHALQYKLDHSRRCCVCATLVMMVLMMVRLVEGSETDIARAMSRTWVTEDMKQTWRQRLNNLKLIAEHIVEVLSSSSSPLPYLLSCPSSLLAAHQGI